MKRFGINGVWALRIAGAGALAALVLYMAGAFSTGRIRPGRGPEPRGLPAPARTATATVETVPVWYEAVGTVRSKVEARVSPQVTGRIVEILVEEGSPVEKGQLIATLVSDEFKARLEQARSALNGATALQERATLAHDRIRRLFDQEAATKEQLEAAEALKKQSDAGVEAASQKLEESNISMRHTRIVSPMNGVVARRDADPGDLAWPGKTLVTVHDTEHLRLVASVREGLIGRVRVGDEVEIFVPALEIRERGTVDEIVPSSDPVSRSFLVKARTSSARALHPGMFGTLRIRVGERKAVTIPAPSITSVGQLRTVLVERDGHWARRYVTIGSTRDGRTEILSGIADRDTVGWKEPGD